MKDKRPSNYTLLIPLAAFLFFSFFWVTAKDISENGTEHLVTITGKRHESGRHKRSYFTFTVEGKELEITESKRHKVGDPVNVIVFERQALEGKRSTPIILLAIRDFGTLSFWLLLIVGIILPLYRWLSFLPDTAFAWIPSRHSKKSRHKKRRR